MGKLNLTYLFIAVSVVTLIIFFNKNQYALLVAGFFAICIAVLAAVLYGVWYFSPSLYRFTIIVLMTGSVLYSGWMLLEKKFEQLGRWLNERSNERQEQNYAAGLDVFPNGAGTDMAVAIAENDLEKVKDLIADGLDINMKGKGNVGFLQYALELNSETHPYQLSAGLIKVLLESGINPNPGPTEYLYGEDNSMIYCWLANNDDDPAIREMLLRAGTRVPSDYWFMDKKEYFQLYLEHGTDINGRVFINASEYIYDVISRDSLSANDYEETDWTPVMKLTNDRKWEEAIALVQLGADVLFKDKYGITLKQIIDSQVTRYATPGPDKLVELNELVKTKAK